jgi:hypothetical protein
MNKYIAGHSVSVVPEGMPSRQYEKVMSMDVIRYLSNKLVNSVDEGTMLRAKGQAYPWSDPDFGALPMSNDLENLYGAV